MIDRLRRLRPFLAATVLVAAAGCGGNATFVYKPGLPAADAARLPAKAAVLVFTDGTADFKQSGSIFGRGQFNLAKIGISGITTALTPEFWAKSFADDLAASGPFRSARFVYAASELVDEEFYVEGTVKKAYGAISLEDLNELSLAFKMVRRADNRPVWVGEVTRSYKTDPGITKGCGASMSCIREKCHAEMNARMAEMFAEARAGMLAAVRSRPEGGAEDDSARDAAASTGEPVAAKPSAQQSRESPEETIDRILKGQ